MKVYCCRYLKSVFPVVEETVLLDTLCSADNNVTYATERLLHLGFNKKDTPPPRVSLRKAKESDEPKDVPKKPPPPPREKTPEEKMKSKTYLVLPLPNNLWFCENSLQVIE